MICPSRTSVGTALGSFDPRRGGADDAFDLALQPGAVRIQQALLGGDPVFSRVAGVDVISNHGLGELRLPRFDVFDSALDGLDFGLTLPCHERNSIVSRLSRRQKSFEQAGEHGVELIAQTLLLATVQGHLDEIVADLLGDEPLAQLVDAFVDRTGLPSRIGFPG